MTDKGFSELREFDRQAIDFEAEISGQSKHGTPISETGQLRNISGGGACLATDSSDHYHQGQQLHLKIKLPEAGPTGAFMSCDVNVEWVRVETNSASNSENLVLGVSLNGPMRFESE